MKGRMKECSRALDLPVTSLIAVSVRRNKAPLTDDLMLFFSSFPIIPITLSISFNTVSPVKLVVGTCIQNIVSQSMERNYACCFQSDSNLTRAQNTRRVK